MKELSPKQTTLDTKLTQLLKKREQDGLLRRRFPWERLGKNGDKSGKIFHFDRHSGENSFLGAAPIPPGGLVSFSGNDYLGLAAHPEYQKGLRSFLLESDDPMDPEFLRAGSTSSPLIRGWSKPTRQLEQNLASKLGYPAAIVYPSGYQTNLGLIRALATLPGSYFLLDRYVHASLLDGLLDRPRQFRRFAHLNYDQLGRQIKKARQEHENLFVVTDGLFSMDGDWADLDRLRELKRETPFTLIMDDAHGLGTLGPTGGGLAECVETQQKSRLNRVDGTLFPDIITGTLSKAGAAQGGFVLGSQSLVHFLENFSRPYIYSTAISPLLAGAGLYYLSQRDFLAKRRAKLRGNIGYFLDNLRDRGLTESIGSWQERQAARESITSPVLPWFPPGSKEKPVSIMEEAKLAREAGLLLVPIRPPTVPPGGERLRISLSAAHTTEQIDRLTQFLASRSQ